MTGEGGIVDIIGGINGLSGLDEAELEALASCASLEGCPDGTVFYAQDDPSTDVFYIVSGVVEISLQRLNGGASGDILTLRSGSLFGIVSFLDDALRDIAAKARGHCLVLRLSGPLLRAACAAEPRVGRAVFELFGRSAARTVRDLTLELRTLMTERG